MLDTGASDVVVPIDMADNLGLEKGATLVASTANGEVSIFASTIQTLKMGEIVLKNVAASINPGMKGEDEVLLGMSALRYLELQQTGDTITLIQRQGQ